VPPIRRLSPAMKVTFILPCVGKREGTEYPQSWLMEPLAIAQLAALTPAAWDREFYDDRLEDIPYDAPTDMVAISVETFTARRAYQIGERFRRRGIPVVMGGFHPSLTPDDAAGHADALVIGEAEDVWSHVLADVAEGNLQRRYEAARRPELSGTTPDRAIYAGKRYVDLALVETGRGCCFACDFCSIAAFFRHSYAARPVGDVMREVRGLRRRNIFFVDDNLAVDRARSLELFRALAPLRIRWAGQVSVHVAGDDELLDAMRRSGCMGVLIGFESLTPDSAAVRGKGIRGDPQDSYESAMAQFARHRLAVYGTFVFGYDTDTRASIEESKEFALRHRLFFAAFNHLVPFPGTPLYRRLHAEQRLIRDDWWLAADYRFGDLAFRPARLTRAELADACLQARRSFYSWPHILKRAMHTRCNCRNAFMTSLFLTSNVMSKSEVDRRQGLPLGADT
jgi:radical SAM superfamily enzyme YgiQ (UPF0313 family)